MVSHPHNTSLIFTEMDGQLKPEFIERVLTGIRSTQPEELRTHRRKRAHHRMKWGCKPTRHPEEKRTRLESAIAVAEVPPA